MKLFFLPILALFIFPFSNCKKESTTKPLPPKKVKKGQYIYHYTQQKHIDTTSFNSFKLKQKDSLKREDIFRTSKLSENEIKNFEEHIENYTDFDKMSDKKRLYIDSNIAKYVRSIDKAKALDFAIKLCKKTENKYINKLVSTIDHHNVLDYLILYGNEDIRKKAQKLLIDKFSVNHTSDFTFYYHYLKDNKSENYFKKIEELKLNLDKKERNHNCNPTCYPSLFYFFQDILPEYARVGGKKSIPNMIKWYKQISKKDPLNNYDYAYGFATAIRILINYYEIDHDTKKVFFNLLKNDPNAISFINQKHLYYKDLNIIKNIFKKSGYNKQLSVEDENAIAQSFYENNYTINIKDVLQRYNLLFFYSTLNKGIGHMNYSGPANYKKTMQLFLDACENDIPTFDIQTYLKSSLFGEPNYAILLGNKKEAFLVKTTDDDERQFNHSVIKDLFNYVLSTKNINKSFEYAKEPQYKKYKAVFYNKPLIDSLLIKLDQKIIWAKEDYLRYTVR